MKIGTQTDDYLVFLDFLINVMKIGTQTDDYLVSLDFLINNT